MPTVEYAFVCSQCGHEEWSEETPVLGGNECPDCGCGMTAAARSVSAPTQGYNGDKQ